MDKLMIGTDFIFFYSCDLIIIESFYVEEKANILQIQPRQMHHVLTLARLGGISFSRFCGDSCNKI